ncbi:MAG: imidazole glycerol phosphate synthase subunit HisH [Eubacteriales bacterium]|nr:imidazole glycerol phosphate synthase subunit HisH [Eubacteriales bacterium]
MICVVDYGVGNLYSLTCSLRHIGAQCVVSKEERDLREAERIILPGVGAFGDAADKLRLLKLDGLLKELAAMGKPLMGICLGMQLLFQKSYEYGEHAGLGLIPGVVRPLAPTLEAGAKVPHMGWNSLTFQQPKDGLLRGVREGDYVYYVHSYYATDCQQALVATSVYGSVTVAGAVRNGNVCGTQFHPEKSGEVGLTILSAFAKGDALC